ncbi:tRNA uridine-5-carboxymethylaminomethyl(34) synthesis GTPase MnmE [symbiont of Argiope bruennichi]|uniref:tRNA uridine-5-carboxymethylaminomethyl(34) synthesis GTPase MnmE n=1 Tax=symbiont of Argiope bruennichi TaxID=2810479 RepID=UPI003DA5BC0B
MNFFDTIVAPATSINPSALAIIRISGNDCYDIFEKLAKKKVSKKQNYYQFFPLYDENNQIIDETVVLFYQKPKSFTGEDLIEIICHGGYFIVEKLLQTICLYGARMAQNGEFSKRAVINQKIDLIKAEAINAVIHAKSSYEYQNSLQFFNPKSESKLNELKNWLLEVISRIEVMIDFPEYNEFQEVFFEEVSNLLEKIQKIVKKIIFFSKKTQKIYQGINVVIFGEPNVGKSLLLNRVAKEDKAIVSNISGTTRDFIDYSFYLDQFLINLIDTAGIRKTDEKIEQLGTKKAKKKLKEADIIIFLTDVFKYKNNFTLKNLKKLENLKKPFLIVINKIDRKKNFDKFLKETDKIIKSKKIFISAKKNNIENLLIELKLIIKNKYLVDQKEISMVYPSVNQISMFKKINLEIIHILNDPFCLQNIDLLSVSLLNLYKMILKLKGEEFDDHLNESIFKKFCVGK